MVKFQIITNRMHQNQNHLFAYTDCGLSGHKSFKYLLKTSTRKVSAESERQDQSEDTHNHPVQGQLAVHLELIGGRHTFAGVEEHV